MSDAERSTSPRREEVAVAVPAARSDDDDGDDAMEVVQKDQPAASASNGLDDMVRYQFYGLIRRRKHQLRLPVFLAVCRRTDWKPDAYRVDPCRVSVHHLSFARGQRLES